MNKYKMILTYTIESEIPECVSAEEAEQTLLDEVTRAIGNGEIPPNEVEFSQLTLCPREERDCSMKDSQGYCLYPDECGLMAQKMKMEVKNYER